ncbi:hypothetical protein ES288_A11G294900v1 [Gossypium darwinii]|uniref:Uncharacterized protein n=1 Tax=Gossypium darwinii TaxID=34276 RepID=A0A5D2ER94_GOSDA|nr:hypothetical protein ES288_A11G294900v1 [Gossypium darwinii]
MKASLVIIVTLLMVEIIDGMGGRICHGREITRMYPAPKPHPTISPSRRYGSPPPPSLSPHPPSPPPPPPPPLLQLPSLSPPPPPPLPPKPIPFFRRSPGDDGRWNKGGYPKMEP